VLDKQIPGRTLTELARELFRLGIDSLTEDEEASHQESALIASLELVHQRLDELVVARGANGVGGTPPAASETRSGGIVR